MLLRPGFRHRHQGSAVHRDGFGVHRHRRRARPLRDPPALVPLPAASSSASAATPTSMASSSTAGASPCTTAAAPGPSHPAVAGTGRPRQGMRDLRRRAQPVPGPPREVLDSGRRTDIDNLALVCHQHHRWIHDNRITLRWGSDAGAPPGPAPPSLTTRRPGPALQPA